MKGQYTKEQLRYILAGLVLGVASGAMFEDEGEDPARCMVSILVDDHKIATAEEIDKMVTDIVKTFGDDLEAHRKRGHKHD